jgi:hypothetical protein
MAVGTGSTPGIGPDRDPDPDFDVDSGSGDHAISAVDCAGTGA